MATNESETQTLPVLNSPHNPLTEDHIAGIVSMHGSFLWVKQNSGKIPVFQLKLHSKEANLLKQIKEKLGINEKIHSYSHSNRNYVILLIRKRWVIINKLIPVFDNRLCGSKKAVYDEWKNKVLAHETNNVSRETI